MKLHTMIAAAVLAGHAAAAGGGVSERNPLQDVPVILRVEVVKVSVQLEVHDATIQVVPLLVELERGQLGGAQLCCNADFNNNGTVLEDDIEAFFACLAGHCCETGPPDADFNCDGDVATDADIEAFLRVLMGGPC
jgi:hypothetical protein